MPRVKTVVRRPATRRLRVIARDPAMRVRGGILTDEVELENDSLGAGPRGPRVYVIDYDSTTQTYYRPISPRAYGTEARPQDPFERAPDRVLLESPAFHAQNVYALATHTLSRFEHALGRHVSFGGGHQIAAVPHAFADANAFYSDRDHALLFGYFPARRRKRMVYSCLSHDVIVHEMAHALLDSLRPHYRQPRSPDNLAFHEGFADLIALLSVFSFPAVVGVGLDYGSGSPGALVPRKALTFERLGSGVLFSLAEQMGTELTGVVGDALRKSLSLVPSKRYLTDPAWREPHRRGEVFVAAMLHAFVRIWLGRIQTLPAVQGQQLYRAHVVAEGVTAAERLLATAARAIDYAPPLELAFDEFLSALLTADTEASPDDTRYEVRTALRSSFAAYGMKPRSRFEGGLWEPAPVGLEGSITAPEREDVFRFLYRNRQALGLRPAFTEVVFVRRNRVPAGRDRFDVLHEFIAEYVQVLRIRACHLKRYGIPRPVGLLPDTDLQLLGGGTLIFAHNGVLKYHIVNDLFGRRQGLVLAYLNEVGALGEHKSGPRHYAAALHRLRQLNLPHTLLDEF